MVRIRLARSGAKKRPFFPIVVTDKRNSRDGNHIEKIGFFNPIATGGEVRLQLSQERLDYWLSQGAQPTDRMRSLIKEAKMGPEAAAAKRSAKAEKVRAKQEAAVAAKAKAEKEAADAEAKAAEEAKPTQEAKPEATDDTAASKDASKED